MQYDTQPAKVPAISRTWEAYHVDRECGVVVGIATYTVTLSRQTGELVATVDGKIVPVLDAAHILKSATTPPKVISEIIPTPRYLLELGATA